MGYQVYRVGKRWGGYGVPAICEHPDCNEEIDRGISFACGGEPFSEYGCDRYFCSQHLEITCIAHFGEECPDELEDCDSVELCERCAKGEEEFPYKPEHPDWIKHLLTDGSWKEWRKESPIEVEELKKQYEIQNAKKKTKRDKN